MLAIFLQSRVRVQRQLFLLLALEGVLIEWLLHDAIELRRIRLLRLELLQELVVVGVEDEHVTIRHISKRVLRVDNRAQ